MNWLLAATFLATVYGVIQYLDFWYFPRPPEPGLDPFIWRGAFGERVFSTFGNPNFFGDFLVVMSPIVLALYIRKRKFNLLALWLLIAFNVIQTKSKGAWLGFGAGLLIFTFLYLGFFLNTQKTKVRRILIILAACTILAVGGGIYQNLKQRTDSASFRIFTWVSTWEMINTHPWIGTGLGSFYVTYPAWRRPQIFFIEARHNTETDHPENEYLEVWFDEGYIGIGLFLWIAALFTLAGLRNLKTFSEIKTESSKRDMRAYYQLGLLTAITSQLVHNLVCVSLRFVSSGVFLWLLVGLVGALSINNPLTPPKPDNQVPVPLKNPLPEAIRRALQVLVVLAAVFFGRMFYGYFDADLNHNLAIFYSKQGQWLQALDRYNTVVKENPSFIMAHYFMGNVYNDRWAQGDAERSIDKYKDVWKLAPNYVQSHHQAGLIYLKWGEDEKRKADEARQRGDHKTTQAHEAKKLELWNKALHQFELYRSIDPIFPLNYSRIAWIHMQLGQVDKAEAAYKEHLNFPHTLQKPPHSPWKENWIPRRRQEYAETCVNLGNMGFMRGDMKDAENYYKQAVEFVPDYVNALKNLAILYGRQNRMQQASELWQKLRTIAPNDPDVVRVFQPPQSQQ